MQIVGHHERAGIDAVHRAQIVHRRFEGFRSARWSRSPTCWLTKAWPSTTSAIAFFKSAPSREDR